MGITRGPTEAPGLFSHHPANMDSLPCPLSQTPPGKGKLASCHPTQLGGPRDSGRAWQPEDREATFPGPPPWRHALNPPIPAPILTCLLPMHGAPACLSGAACQLLQLL